MGEDGKDDIRQPSDQPELENPTVEIVEIDPALLGRLADQSINDGRTLTMRTLASGKEDGKVAGVRIKNGEAVGIAESQVVVGDHTSVPLYKAHTEVEKDDDVSVLVRHHTHPKGASPFPSEADGKIWTNINRSKGILHPEYGIMKVVGSRPVNLISTPRTDEEWDMVVLAQLSEQVDIGKLQKLLSGRGLVQIFGELGGGAPNSRAALMFQSLGFEITRFRFPFESAEARLHLESRLPKQVKLQEIGGASPIGPKLDFLGKK